MTCFPVFRTLYVSAHVRTCTAKEKICLTRTLTESLMLKRQTWAWGLVRGAGREGLPEPPFNTRRKLPRSVPRSGPGPSSRRPTRVPPSRSLQASGTHVLRRGHGLACVWSGGQQLLPLSPVMGTHEQLVQGQCNEEPRLLRGCRGRGPEQGPRRVGVAEAGLQCVPSFAPVKPLPCSIRQEDKLPAERDDAEARPAGSEVVMSHSATRFGLSSSPMRGL